MIDWNNGYLTVTCREDDYRGDDYFVEFHSDVQMLFLEFYEHYDTNSSVDTLIDQFKQSLTESIGKNTVVIPVNPGLSAEHLFNLLKPELLKSIASFMEKKLTAEEDRKARDLATFEFLKGKYGWI